MGLKRSAVVLCAAAVLSACGGEPAAGQEAVEAGPEAGEGTVSQQEYTDHAIVTCQSATMYGNYSTTSGPRDPIRVLYYGDKVGIRQNAGTASWAVILDYGPNDWGYLLRSCMTRCYGPNNPIAGCF